MPPTIFLVSLGGVIVIIARGVARMHRANFAASIRVGQPALVAPAMNEMLRPSQKSVQAIKSRLTLVQQWLSGARGLLQNVFKRSRHIPALLWTRTRQASKRLAALRPRWQRATTVEEPNIDALFNTSAATLPPTAPAAVDPVLVKPNQIYRRDHAAPKKKKKLTALQRAQVALHSKDYQHAENILVEHIVHHTKDTKAYMLLGRIATAKADWSEAMEIYEQVINLHPTEPGAQAGLGIAAYNCGRYAKALTALQRAHEADPSNTLILQDLLGIAQKMDNPALQRSIRAKLQEIAELTPQTN